MPKMSISQKIFFLVLTGLLIYLLTQGPALPTGTSTLLPSVTTQVTPLPTAEKNIAAQPLTCLSDGQVSEILGQKFVLLQESYLKELDLLTCSYQSPDLVKDLTPSVKYSIRRNPDPQYWKDTKDQISKKSGYRTIIENSNIFAEINPVVEVNQGTFYGNSQTLFVELNFTPVKLPVGDILSRGTKATEILLQ
jgi:hypothetical protein